MKPRCILIFGLGAALCTALCARGQTVPVAGRFSVEFSRTGKSSAVDVPVSPDTLPPETTQTLRMIVGADDADMGDRIEAVHKLGNELTSFEIAALAVFVNLPEMEGATDAWGLHALKNDILNVLRAQTPPPPDLTRLLIGLYHNRAQNAVMRDYAIQHLSLWHERDDVVSAEERKSIRTVLNEAMRENNSIAGTALLGLHRLAVDLTPSDANGIDRMALQLAQSAETETATRLTAIQVCAERGLKEVLPTAEALAQETDCIPLQLSAMAAFRRLGGLPPADTVRREELRLTEIKAGTSPRPVEKAKEGPG